MKRRPLLSWADVKSRMVLGSFAANFAGACFIFGYLEFIAPFPPRWRTETVVDALLALGLLIVTALVQHQLIRRRFRQATAWMAEGRPPTPAEQQATLTLPWRATEFSVLAWAGGAVAFAAWAWIL
ncbi:MAG: adenylate cyclase, partial [Acidimicrobiaceae bacterium]|nr:adenylate cyclase [Acidimicrobiaceae bacterium]